MKKVYNKLVRDKIPEIISENGGKPVIKTITDEEYKKELEKKLYEEYNEVLNAQGEDRIEELADMLEVIKALAKLQSKSIEDIICVADKKANKRGAFDKKIFLVEVVE